MGLLLSEASPHKIFSQIGLYIFDGTRGVGMGIENTVDEKNDDKLFVIHDVGCSACEMAVVWMQSQLWKNQTQECILEYVNELYERLPSPMRESTMDCLQLSSMTNVSFTIGGKVCDLSANEYVLKVGGSLLRNSPKEKFKMERIKKVLK